MKSKKLFLILFAGIGLLWWAPKAEAWHYKNFSFYGGDLYNPYVYSPYAYVNPPIGQGYYFNYGYPGAIVTRHYYRYYNDYPDYYYYRPYRYRYYDDGGYYYGPHYRPYYYHYRHHHRHHW